MVQQLAKSMGTLSSHLTAMRVDVAGLKTTLGSAMASHAALVAKLDAFIQASTQASPISSGRPFQAGSASPMLPQTPLSPQAPTSPQAGLHHGSPALEEVVRRHEPTNINAILMSAGKLSHATTWKHPKTLAHLFADDFWYNVKNEGAVPSTLDSASAARAEKVMRFMDAMATSQERATMMDTRVATIGTRKALAEKISKLVLGRMIDAFEAAIALDSNLKMPIKLRQGVSKGMLAGAVEERLNELRTKFKQTLVPDEQSFSAWRNENEGRYTAGGPIQKPKAKKRKETP